MLPDETDRRSALIHSIRPLLIFANAVCFERLKSIYPRADHAKLKQISKRIAPECIRPVNPNCRKLIQSALNDLPHNSYNDFLFHAILMHVFCDKVRTFIIHQYNDILDNKIDPKTFTVS